MLKIFQVFASLLNEKKYVTSVLSCLCFVINEVVIVNISSLYSLINFLVYFPLSNIYSPLNFGILDLDDNHFLQDELYAYIFPGINVILDHSSSAGLYIESDL